MSNGYNTNTDYNTMTLYYGEQNGIGPREDHKVSFADAMYARHGMKTELTTSQVIDKLRTPDDYGNGMGRFSSVLRSDMPRRTPTPAYASNGVVVTTVAFGNG